MVIYNFNNEFYTNRGSIVKSKKQRKHFCFRCFLCCVLFIFYTLAVPLA